MTCTCPHAPNLYLLPSFLVRDSPAPAQCSVHIAKQLGLQDVLPLLVLLARLERLVVLPAHRLLALAARDVPHDVPARRHVTLAGVARRDVDDVVKEVCFAVLAAEVLHANHQRSATAQQDSGTQEAGLVRGMGRTYPADDVLMVC